MSGKQQKAVFVTEIGQPVQLGKRDIPSPKSGEILVKVTATMLLPHDTYGRDWGLFIGEKLPFVLGSNVAGTVEQVGDGVKGLKSGDSVFGISDLMAPQPDQAGLQEYAILHADAVARTPSAVSKDQAVALPVNIVTSWLALFGPTGLGFTSPLDTPSESVSSNADKTLIILGAGASVGKFAVQLASLAGIRKIIVVAGAGSKDTLLAMGATHFVDRNAGPSEIVKQVHGLTGGGQGVTHVYHSHGFDYALDIALLPADTPSSLQSVHPIDDEEGQKLTSARPQCKTVMLEVANEALAPRVREFWEMVPKWLVEGKVKAGSLRVVEGLEKVEDINGALDGYREGTGVQVIVHP